VIGVAPHPVRLWRSAPITTGTFLVPRTESPRHGINQRCHHRVGPRPGAGWIIARCQSIDQLIPTSACLARPAAIAPRGRPGAAAGNGAAGGKTSGPEAPPAPRPRRRPSINGLPQLDGRTRGGGVLIGATESGAFSRQQRLDRGPMPVWGDRRSWGHGER
jgi:hypothetical protein